MESLKFDIIDKETVEEEIRTALDSTEAIAHKDEEEGDTTPESDTSSEESINVTKYTLNNAIAEETNSNFIANPESSIEGYGLYKHLFIDEVQINNVRGVPKNLLAATSTYPQHARIFLNLAQKFRRSPQRYSVYQQAQSVDLTTLNSTTFRELLDSLFLV